MNQQLWLRPEHMAIFIKVAALQSFHLAAESLSLPNATVSHAVKALEARLGTQLLQRTTRKVALTQDGQRFLARAEYLLAELEETRDLFQQDEVFLAGRLRVDMPVGVARDIVMPVLPEFLERHPAIELELSSTDRLVNLVQEGFDCVLRVGQLEDSSLIARPLGHFRVINCVSKHYVQLHGCPETLEDLSQHWLVAYRPVLGSGPDAFEYLDPADKRKTHSIPMKNRITVNNSDAYLGACLSGLGLIQVPLTGKTELLQRGELIEVLTPWQAAPMPVTLLYGRRLFLPRRVAVFMGWLEEVLAPHLTAKGAQ